MNTLEALLTRRSYRKYLDKTPEKELLEKVAEAGTYAPTGMGKQSPIIITVTNKELRDKLSKANAAVMGSDNDPFYGAPAVMIVLVDKTIGTWAYDGPIVMQNLMLAAHELGLATCWIHRAKEVMASDLGKEILTSLGLDPEKYEGVGNVIIGYPDGDKPVAKERKADYVYWIE